MPLLPSLSRFRDILSGRPPGRQTGDMETTKRVWVAATLDTKSDEANYVCTLLEAAGVPVALADLSTSGSSVPAADADTFFARRHRRVSPSIPERGIYWRPGNCNCSNERCV